MALMDRAAFRHPLYLDAIDPPHPCHPTPFRLFSLPMNTRIGIDGNYTRATSAPLPLALLLGLIGVRRVS